MGKALVERRALVAIMACGLAIRVVYVIAHHGAALSVDEIFYDTSGRLAASGHWLWGASPYGIPHATFWKMPLYPLLVDASYAVLGTSPLRVELLQALLGPVAIWLTWLLARRLFGSERLGLVAAAIVAVYPFTWQFTVLLFPESLALPIVLAIMVVGLERPPTPRLAVILGLMTGVATLVRPNAFVFLAAIAIGWLVAGPWRRSLALAALAAVCAALPLVPWTIRNYDLSHHFVPFSVQDAALYGTFNDTAAHDKRDPWAWRPLVPAARQIYDRAHPLGDAELRIALQKLGRDYIEAHPSSVVKAFYWNGIRRAWDLHGPDYSLRESDASGGVRWITAIGLAMYWVMLPFALFGLWKLRRRRPLFWTIVAFAILSSIVEIPDAATRYRVPLEPLIVILACSAAPGGLRLRSRS